MMYFLSKSKGLDGRGICVFLATVVVNLTKSRMEML